MKWFFTLIVIVGIVGNFVHSDSIDLGTSNNDPVIGNTKVISKLGSITATIGDEQNNTFQPHLKISRKFFEDANLTISWNTNIPSLGNTNVLIEDKVVKYKRSNHELWFYQLPYGSDPDKGGFEFMAIMNSRPQTNTITFKISSNNLDFFYQGPLKAEGEFANYTCNATACMDKGRVMAERPEKVVGSYAIFHKTKKDNQYTTGKVGHIYRPYVVDSLGAFTWADINIEGTMMTITIPQKFLDDATYPIYIDPSIGYDTIGASGANWLGDSIRGNYVYSPASDGNLTAIYVRHYIGTIGIWRGIVFINSTNAVRAYTSAKNQAGSPAWDTTDFNNGTTTIFAGTNYMLGLWLGTTPNMCGLYYDDGGTSYARGSQTFSETTAPADPQSWGSGKPVSGTQYHFSMYANYTETTSSNFTPAFNITITAPANGSTYTYPYNFTYNFTAIGNATNYDIKYRLDSNANVTYGNVANNTNIFYSLGNLSAGIHSLVVYATNETVTNTSNNITFTINRASMPIYQLLNGAWQNLTITYPTSSNASGYKNIAEGTLLLYRNGTSYTIPDIATLGAGAYNYTLYFAQTENYTTNSTSLFVTVNQNSSYSLSIAIVPGTSVTYGTQTTVTGSGCPSGLTCTLYKGATGVSNPYVSTEGAGSVIFWYNSTGNANYSSKSATSTLTINQYTQFCNASIDGVWQNKTITYGTSATINGSSSNVSGLLYRNGTSVSYPQIITSGGGGWNYTFYSAGNANFTSCRETVFLTVNKATPSLSVTLAPSDTVTYPTTTTATGVGCTAPLSCTLYRGVTTVASPDTNIYNVGAYNYIYNTTGNENYSSASGSNLLTVNQNTTWWLNITVTPSATVTFGTETNVTGIRCPTELTCTLYRNGTSVTNSDVKTLGVGTYNYTYHTPGNANYGAKSTNQTVIVNQYTQWCNLTINGTEGNKTYVFGTPTNATGNSSNLTSGTLYRNGTGVSNPELATLAVGTWNYTIVENVNQNFTSCFKTYFVQINSTASDTFIQSVNINHPLNGSIFTYPYNLTAYFNITGNASTYTAKYNLDAGANNTLGSINNNTNTTIGLGILLGGWHNVTVCATNSTENCSTSFFFINFTDSTPPYINITSPLNATYTQCSNNILLNATANETIVSWWFSLNGGVNTSFTPTVYITAINGSNNITVWANDSSGNIGYNITYFNLALTICPTPIPSNATNIIVVLDAKPTGDNNLLSLGIMAILFIGGIGVYYFMSNKKGSTQGQETINLTNED